MPISADHDLQRASIPPPLLSGSDRRTYEALFHHPSSNNLKWHDIVHLFEKLGTVTEKTNHEYVMTIGEAQHIMRRPHSKDLTSEEIRDLRHFVVDSVAVEEIQPAPASALDMLIVMDHQEARIFAADLPAHGAAAQDIHPYDPHNFLHHLSHKDQPRERGQRAHEDATFYDRIAQAVVSAQRIVIIGHGAGKSDAGHHLMGYLAAHHSEIAGKIVAELSADLSHTTAPELLAIAREALANT
jgi:hypothetical protein